MAQSQDHMISLIKFIKNTLQKGSFRNSNVKTIQSKICKMSLETLNVSGTTVETGNLVFSENIENTTKKIKRLLLTQLQSKG